MGSPGKIHDRAPDLSSIFLGMDALKTSQLNVTSIARYVLINVLDLFFGHVMHGCVCTTRHWQASDRLVQELSSSTELACFVVTTVLFLRHAWCVISVRNSNMEKIVRLPQPCAYFGLNIYDSV